jgi:alanine-glyoxylate transaminase/serine-glyoxylate transaminase/serine-pyruvate transaminase
VLTCSVLIGTLGWDMTACNLLQKGDKALVVNTGYFGDRFGEW